jgi:hypothetical protein
LKINQEIFRAMENWFLIESEFRKVIEAGEIFLDTGRVKGHVFVQHILVSLF